MIEAHLKYYIDTTKKSLGFCSDSLIESMRQNVEAEIQVEKLLLAVKYLNAYNLE